MDQDGTLAGSALVYRDVRDGRGYRRANRSASRGSIAAEQPLAALAADRRRKEHRGKSKNG